MDVVVSELGVALRAGLVGTEAARSTLRGSGCGEWGLLASQEGRVGILMLLPPGVKKKMLPSTRPLPGTPRASCPARGFWRWAP